VCYDQTCGGKNQENDYRLKSDGCGMMGGFRLH